MMYCGDMIANVCFLSDFIELLVRKKKCNLYFVLWFDSAIHQQVFASKFKVTRVY